MKILIGAIALVIASPAMAQTAPQADPHAQHQPGQHPSDQHQMPQHQMPQHEGQGAQGGCCADRDGDGRMDCCQHMAQAAEHRDCCAERPAAAQPQGHDGR